MDASSGEAMTTTSDATSLAMSTGRGDTSTQTAAPDDTSDDAIVEDFGRFTDMGRPPGAMIDCRDAPPDGSDLPAPLPTYAGTCPELQPGINAIDSAGNLREFMLVLPEDLDESERLPVAFLWHWLGGDPEDFLEQGDVQNAVNQFRFAAVLPYDKGDLIFRWPFTIIDADPRVEEELQFFDDMLGCVGEQLNVEPNCVASAGVSAGALFTAQLASGRGQHLSSILSLSGGTGGAVLRPWGGSLHKMPAMVLWGGAQDFCVAVDFNLASQDLEQNLEAEGHFVLECVHNCMHSAPPFEVGDGDTAFAPLWSFMMSHPYWLDAGDSPYLESGVPEDMPEWCAAGVGQATERVGECGPDQC